MKFESLLARNWKLQKEKFALYLQQFALQPFLTDHQTIFEQEICAIRLGNILR